jgi:hypothetical protein
VEDVTFIGLDEFKERTCSLHSPRGKHNEESTQLILMNTSSQRAASGAKESALYLLKC